MALKTVGEMEVGSIISLMEGNSWVYFRIVQQGKPSDAYDDSCNGTWVMRTGIYSARQWHTSDVNDYENSSIHSWLNQTYLKLFPAALRNYIKQVRIPYRPGSGASMSVKSGSSGLLCRVFLVSEKELGLSGNAPLGSVLDWFADTIGTDANLHKFQMRYSTSSDYSWWTRNPSSLTNDSAIIKRDAMTMSKSGRSAFPCSTERGIVPFMVLDPQLQVSDDNKVNMAPTTPGSISLPSTINGGTTITLSWGASTDAENNLEGYVVERSTDGGSTWTQIYQGSARSATNTVAFGTETVMYRVRAYDSLGLYSSYRTSAQATVINNTAPSAPPGITVPETVLGGGSLTVTWGAAIDVDGNLTGYELERQTDGGEWAQVCKGADTSYTDTITRGWQSVNYRVRAYDAYNAYSGWTTGTARTVDNNRAPVITSGTVSGTDLGKKEAGFSVSYSVSDEDGDSVTMAEAIDGVELRTFCAGDESNTFSIDGDTFFKLLNGSHVLTITAGDGQTSTVHKLTFTKEVTAATITLKEPFAADDKITICVLSVAGDIPADADYTVEVTNNGNDDAPVWEDCTMEVRSGGNHVFENETAAKGFVFNFRVSAKRGPSGQGGYISSVRGGFQ